MENIGWKFITALLSGLVLVSPSSATVPPPPEPSIALISKVILDVSRKPNGKDWVSAKRGEVLGSGDRVKTGEKSTAVIKFMDNSLVRIRERSELTITGELKDGAFSKSVNLQKGVIGFNVQKQKKEEVFSFTSPTSVASIRGTGGEFILGGAADTLVVIEGTVALKNSFSSQSMDVASGFTGISATDGTLQVRPSTPQERASAENAAQVESVDKRLEFELRDSQGNRKKLKIDYKE